MMRTAYNTVFCTATLACLALLSGCASDEDLNLTAQEMLDRALEMEETANYEGAIKMYNEIQVTHPFGPYAQQSLLNLAHLHFSIREYDAAILETERFFRYYPTHGRVDYARYLRAVSLQRDQASLLDKIILADSGTNSRSALLESHEAFSELVALHPESKYTPASLERMREIAFSLASNELQTSIHYMRIGAYAAAVRRASQLIIKYPNSETLEPALAVMIASLTEMQADKPLNDASDALATSYPDSQYLAVATKGSEALLDHWDIDREPGDYFTALIE